MRLGRKISAVAGLAGAMMLIAGPAYAHECSNASRPPTAGALAIVNGTTGDIEWLSPHAEALIAQFGFDNAPIHGWLAIDFDGDGIADSGTYLVTPNFELPFTAQSNGNPCRGVVNLDYYLGNCLTG